MPPRIVKRGAAAKRASRGSSKAAPENQPEPETAEVVVKNNEENPVVDAVVEEKPVDVEQEHEEVPNGSAKVESKSLFYYIIYIYYIFFIWILTGCYL